MTGATGLVGQHLVEALQQVGDEVRALVRPSSALPDAWAPGIQTCLGDLLHPDGVGLYLEGVDVVYHCAARLAVGGSRAAYWPLNVDANRALLQAAAARGVRRFVFVSSIAAYGVSGHLVPEEQPLLARDPYGGSKAAAEEIVGREEFGRVERVIVRPCLVYGPGDRFFLPRVAPLARRLGWLPVPLAGGGMGTLDLVHAADVAMALVLAGRCPVAAGRAYNVTGGDPRPLRQILEILFRAAGRRLRVAPVPRGAVALALKGLGLLSRGERPRGRGVLAGNHHCFDISRVQAELGYRPRVRLEEALPAAVRLALAEG
ncbi:MAG: NAD-dependent epimerase/dehydratase family protein [Chloroflexi bacterium]|nr:NAD-dependent epimerase/dehydratase family protein [Chloroflexota bacterium]